MAIVTKQPWRNPDIDLHLNISLMNKPEVVRKNPFRQLEEDTLRGARLKSKPILIWATPSYKILLFCECLLYSQAVLCVLKVLNFEYESFLVSLEFYLYVFNAICSIFANAVYSLSK